MGVSQDQLAWALTLVPLSSRDRRAASLVCTAWRDAINASWAYSGIAVRDNAVADLLLQPRWDALGRLTVYAPGDPRLRTTFTGLPREMAALWHLHLRRVTLPAVLGGAGSMWAEVLRQAPKLRSVDLELQMYMTNYGLYLGHARALMVVGSDTLEAVALRGTGLVVYPLGLAAMETDAAFFAAQQARGWPVVVMPFLKTYVNTGRQFASLAVDAYRLRTAEIEEPDAGDWILGRLGPGCRGLRTLTWSVPVPYTGAFPMFCGVVQRFPALRDLSLTFRGVNLPANLGVALASLSALPHGLQRLAVDVDVRWPFGPVDWDRGPLAHLADLRDLSLRVSYATKGFEGALDLLGAPAGVQRVTVGVRHACFPRRDDSDNSDSDSDEFEGLDMRSWDIDPRVARALADRPACHVTVENLPVTLCHPRLTISRL